MPRSMHCPESTSPAKWRPWWRWLIRKPVLPKRPKRAARVLHWVRAQNEAILPTMNTRSLAEPRTLTQWLPDLFLGLENLATHKLRSLLTMLGMIFGVAAVVAMLSIGAGA